MPFSRKTLSDIVTTMKDDIKTGLDMAGFENVELSFEKSVFVIFAKTFAGAIHELYGKLVWLSKQLFPDTAEGEYLERWASIWRVTRLAAEKATGTILITGQSGSTINDGEILVRADTIQFEVDTAAPLVIPGGGSIEATVIAVTAGLAGNTETGAVLTFQSPPSGVDAEATVQTPGLLEGTDLETDANLLIRLLARIGLPPHGGNQPDYVNWMKEVSGVTRAWCYPLFQGEGTVGVFFVMDDKTTYPNLVEDGGFNEMEDPTQPWVCQSGWTIGSGKASNDGSNNAIYQYIDITPGHSYRVKFTVLDRTTGTLKIYLGTQKATYDVTNSAYAQGDVTFSGTPSTNIPAGTVVYDPEDETKEWTVDTGGPIGGGGTVDLAVTASGYGYNYNRAATYALKLKESISGVDDDCEVATGGLTGGALGNGEHDQVVAAAGPADIPIWFVSDTGFDGSIDNVEVLDEVTPIIPGVTEIATVRDYLEVKPVTAFLFVERLEARKVPITIDLKEIDPSYTTAQVQANIQANLDDLFYREGEPPDDPDTTKKLLLTHIQEAISGAEGEEDFAIDSLDGGSPADITISNGEILLLGTITWS